MFSFFKRIANEYNNGKKTVEPNGIVKQAGYYDLIQGQRLKDILNDTFSSKLAELGLRWRGDYYWIGEAENGIRKIVSIYLLKARAVITWGVAFDFVSTVSGSKLIYNRTEKSATEHLFEWPIGYKNSFNGIKMVDGYGVFSLSNEYELKSTAKQALDGEYNSIKEWLERASSIEGAFEIAQEQASAAENDTLSETDYSHMYQIHYPSPNYILAFLLAKLGNKEEAISMINDIGVDYFNNRFELFEEIKKLLKAY